MKLHSMRLNASRFEGHHAGPLGTGFYFLLTQRRRHVRGLATKELERENLSVWQDIIALHEGEDWRSQIEDAQRSTDLQHFVLVVTPAALESRVVFAALRARGDASGVGKSRRTRGNQIGTPRRQDGLPGEGAGPYRPQYALLRSI
jgi:hypothetical protein